MSHCPVGPVRQRAATATSCLAIGVILWLLMTWGCATPPAVYASRGTALDADPPSPDPDPTGVPASPSPTEESTRPGAIERFLEKHRDFIESSNRFDPLIEVEGLIQGNTEIRHEPGDFDLIKGSADVQLPVPIARDVFLLTGGRFSARDLDTSPSFPTDDETLYEIVAHAGLGFFLGEDLMIVGRFSPGVYSDLETSLTSDDIQYLGAALGIWRFGEGKYLKFGAALDELFHKIDVYPLLGLSWVMNDRWRADVLLPVEAQISYAPASWAILHSRVWLDGARFRIRDGSGSQELEDDVNVQALRAGIGGTWRMTPQVSVTGEIGAVITGDYDLKRADGPRADGSLDPGYYARVSLGFGF